jgi:hypothetical protein
MDNELSLCQSGSLMPRIKAYFVHSNYQLAAYLRLHLLLIPPSRGTDTGTTTVATRSNLILLQYFWDGNPWAQTHIALKHHVNFPPRNIMSLTTVCGSQVVLFPKTRIFCFRSRFCLKYARHGVVLSSSVCLGGTSEHWAAARTWQAHATISTQWAITCPHQSAAAHKGTTHCGSQ